MRCPAGSPARSVHGVGISPRSARVLIGGLVAAAVVGSGLVVAQHTTSRSELASGALLWMQEPAAAGAVPAAAQPWGSCALATEDKVIRAFPRAKVLRCGHNGYGQWHIDDRHREDWEQLAASSGQDWRAVADLAIDSALGAPAVVRERAANDTRCYSTAIYLVDVRTGVTVGSSIVRVVAGNRSNNIVTAFPSPSHCRGDE